MFAGSSYLIDRSCLDLSATSVNGIGKVNEFHVERKIYCVHVTRPKLVCGHPHCITDGYIQTLPADGWITVQLSISGTMLCLYLSIHTIDHVGDQYGRYYVAVASALCNDTTSLALVLLPLIGDFLLLLRRTQIESTSFSEQVATTTDAAALLTAFGGHLLLGVLEWVCCPICPAPLKRVCHDILAVCIAQGQSTQPVVALCGHWCQSVHMYGSDLCPFIWPADSFKQ